MAQKPCLYTFLLMALLVFSIVGISILYYQERVDLDDLKRSADTLEAQIAALEAA